MKDFWSGIIRRLTAADAKCRCCSHPMIVRRMLDNSHRFQAPCYWFSCETQEVEHALFLICVDGNTSTLFEIPAHTFAPGQFDLDGTIKTQDARYNNIAGYRETHFDIFLETSGHYMELRKRINFDSYMIASETNWNVQVIKEIEEEE